MKPTHLVVLLALSSNFALANDSACSGLAAEQRLSGDARQQFIDTCMAGRDHGMNMAERANKTESVAQPAQAGCDSPNACADLSTRLEATAAGLGGEEKANSGHSFVRLKRVSENR